MNLYKDESSTCCYFHPKEIFVGICPLCLNERLLVLASKQTKHHSSSSSSSSSSSGRGSSTSLVPNIDLPNIFSFGSLLNRIELRRPKFIHTTDPHVSTTQRDSFISIQFEENGIASWEKNKVSKVSLEHCSVSWSHHALAMELPKETNKSIIEHPKNSHPMRWRKRIGHLFQLIRLKRPSSGHVATKVEGVKVKKQSWIRTFTKRKAKK